MPGATVLRIDMSDPAIMAGVPQRLSFAAGLPPFMDAKEFTLQFEPNAPPFLRMSCTSLDLAYVLIDPFLINPDYQPEFADADFAELDIQSNDKALILSIVNFSRGADEVTANLIGPLLINVVSGKAKQVLLENAFKYSSRYKLLQNS